MHNAVWQADVLGDGDTAGELWILAGTFTVLYGIHHAPSRICEFMSKWERTLGKILIFNCVVGHANRK